MALEHLGLRAGEQIRFRRPDRKRWQVGVVRSLGSDGSIGVIDADGASRSVAAAMVEVRRTGPRGRAAWEPLIERAGRTEQQLLLPPPVPRKDERRR